MVTITFSDRETEKRALAFLLGRFSGRVLQSGEHSVPEAALEALAKQNIPFSVKGRTTYEQLAAIRCCAGDGRVSIRAMKAVSATEFKEKCLALLDEVQEGHEPIAITKRGTPVAVLGPARRRRFKSSAGSWAGRIEEVGDIVNFSMWEGVDGKRL